MTKSSLARHLQVPVERRSELRKSIEALVAEGLIEEKKKACYMLRAKTGNALAGTLKLHRKGHAFFYLDPDHIGPIFSRRYKFQLTGHLHLLIC